MMESDIGDDSKDLWNGLLSFHNSEEWIDDDDDQLAQLRIVYEENVKIS